jgi:hypothetical protein
LGTQRPEQLSKNQSWGGQYASSDGQIVTDNDAKMFAQVLHAAAVHPKLPVALSDVIASVEAQVAATGTSIPAQMRMNPNDFSKEFSPLLLFLYKGSFVIG